MTGLLSLFALGLVVAWLLVVWQTVRTLRRPPRRGYAAAVARGLPGDPGELDRPAAYIEFTLERAMAPVWAIEGDDPAGPLIVATHGWGRSRLDALVRFDAVRHACSRFLAWDLPGHGDAPGVTQLGATEHRALLELVDRAFRDGMRPVVLWGWSMGAGVSIRAAGDLGRDGRLAGVIAESPYRIPRTPAANVLHLNGLPHRPTLGPALWIIGLMRGDPGWRGFDRAEAARHIRAPLLVLHGSEDSVSPPADGRAIAAAAPQGRYEEIEGGTHNGLWLDETSLLACRRSVVAFLGSLHHSGEDPRDA
ncbi:MAG: alpha/beta fold hydrolase [Phycisphaerales bacterium]